MIFVHARCEVDRALSDEEVLCFNDRIETVSRFVDSPSSLEDSKRRFSFSTFSCIAWAALNRALALDEQLPSLSRMFHFDLANSLGPSRQSERSVGAFCRFAVLVVIKSSSRWVCLVHRIYKGI